MHSNWFFQGLLTNGTWWVLEALMVIVGGVAVAWLKKIQSEWAAPMLYGLAAVCGLAGIAILLLMYAVVSSQGDLKAELEPEHLESTVKQWVSSYGWGVIGDSREDSTFTFWATTPHTSKQILIFQPKGQPGYLVAEVDTMIPLTFLQSIMKSDDLTKARIINDIQLELLRRNPDMWSLSLPKLTFQKYLFVDNAMTKESLRKEINDIDSTQDVMANMIQREMVEFKGMKVGFR